MQDLLELGFSFRPRLLKVQQKRTVQVCERVNLEDDDVTRHDEHVSKQQRSSVIHRPNPKRGGEGTNCQKLVKRCHGSAWSTLEMM